MITYGVIGLLVVLLVPTSFYLAGRGLLSLGATERGRQLRLGLMLLSGSVAVACVLGAVFTALEPGVLDRHPTVPEVLAYWAGASSLALLMGAPVALLAALLGGLLGGRKAARWTFHLGWVCGMCVAGFLAIQAGQRRQHARTSAVQLAEHASPTLSFDAEAPTGGGRSPADKGGRLPCLGVGSELRPADSPEAGLLRYTIEFQRAEASIELSRPELTVPTFGVLAGPSVGRSIQAERIEGGIQFTHTTRYTWLVLPMGPQRDPITVPEFAARVDGCDLRVPAAPLTTEEGPADDR